MQPATVPTLKGNQPAITGQAVTPIQPPLPITAAASAVSVEVLRQYSSDKPLVTQKVLRRKT